MTKPNTKALPGDLSTRRSTRKSASKAVAKVFISGGSQAIRLPRQFRLDTKEVYVTREKGLLIIHPKPKTTWREFFASFEPFPEFDIKRDASPPRPVNL